MLSFIGNIIWFLFGGVFMALGWFLAGCLMALSIVGLPWARAAFNIAKFALMPFGRTLVRRDTLTGRSDIGTSAFGFIGNVIWFVFAGWWLCIGHIMSGLACCLTIIGIPWGWQHFKIAAITLAPIGMAVVPIAHAERAQGMKL
ncbi:YccF domain-containing protein [Pseudodesulfovibrio piezophilus]|uniref:Inner membrane protein yccF n=1 Tax=Pseudodesulfovibrio piezophilus (strain DSM 21447 / JCM 15486 / C1TLV30) TaxID=1322246 RepID=M1WTW9_PSEP2|nr:YccF domain-containing protein [Pseudodesulfovibrio piezophilus]CCH49967.1 Inner membrane protein yccF [Pseudodesulfovibrio piezophilus C1TLV30]